jgi:N-acetylglucosamine-6-sulfatase
VAFWLALAATALAAVLPALGPADPATLPPNILIVLTDDQTFDTVPSPVGAPSMPWLESQMRDPAGHWVTFSHAFLDTPLCCPSRATILTGLTSVHTGVQTNADGFDLDESSTLATWLDQEGYETGLIGKSLNDFPWGGNPYVPAGWDRFMAKQNQGLETTYYGYHLIDQAVNTVVGEAPQDYATTYLADQALGFLQTASRDAPWFLLFTPPAPHEPWLPAPEDRGAFAVEPVPMPSLRDLNDVRGKPAWIRALPPITAHEREVLIEARRHERETLLAVDRALESLSAAVDARGELDRTLIIVLTDNGFSFGEHRWRGKRCAYEECVRTPLIVRSPWATSGTVDASVTNVDLAPTIMDLVSGITQGEPLPTDGVSLRPWLEGVLLQYAGDDEVPAWTAVRTNDFKFVDNADGTEELYDLTGVLGPADPHELRNVAGNTRSEPTLEHLKALLASLVAAQGEG